MPTYPYACTACDNRFEVVQSFTDDALTECDVCGGRLRKVFSSVGVVFKGSGFYRNDSRSTSGSVVGSGEAKGSTESSSGGGDKPAAGGDKPAAATPAPASPTTPAAAKPATPAAAKGSAA